MQEVDLIFKPILIFVSNNSHIECITKSLICIIYKLLVQKYVKFVFNKKKSFLQSQRNANDISQMTARKVTDKIQKNASKSFRI